MARKGASTVSCEHLICATCAGPVAEGRCATCRAARAEVHGHGHHVSAQLWLLIAGLVLLAAFLALHTH
jgi:hypothetical protein